MEDLVVTNEIVDSAQEHRMYGLLWSAVERQLVQVEDEAGQRLAILDLAEFAAHQRQWKTIAHIVDLLRGSGIDVAVIKGVVAEARWFDRMGERPSADIDLVIRDPGRFGDAVALLHPDHPLLAGSQRAIDSGVIQSLDLSVDGMPIDFHVDPLKLGVSWRGRDRWWSTAVDVARPDGGTVPAFGTEETLVQMLIHVARDRFRYLLGVEEVRRIAAEADWSRVRELAKLEGVVEPVLVAAAVVAQEVAGFAPPPVEGWRVPLWRRLWAPRIRLLGDLGKLRFIRRGKWLLPLTARGRTWEALTHIARTVFPPAEVVAQKHGKGPYLWRLFAGRLGVVWHRRREVRRLGGVSSSTAERPHMSQDGTGGPSGAPGVDGT